MNGNATPAASTPATTRAPINFGTTSAGLGCDPGPATGTEGTCCRRISGFGLGTGSVRGAVRAVQEVADLAQTIQVVDVCGQRRHRDQGDGGVRGGEAACHPGVV